MTIHQMIAKKRDTESTAPMPALFVGHGSPMNGIEDNTFTLGWETLGKNLPKPKAILVISAHWLTEGSLVHTKALPKTIYDFYGFPPQLYKLSYPAPGSPELAAQMIQGSRGNIAGDEEWGFDHGTWIPLLRMFPKADIPVYQLSLDITKSAREHYVLAKELSILRKRGVLIIGSGNIVHNLRRIDFDPNAKIFDWAQEFDENAKQLILRRGHEQLIGYEKMGDAAMLAVPTPDHYWPLLYILAQQSEGESASFPIEGMTNGSISMRSVRIG